MADEEEAIVNELVNVIADQHERALHRERRMQQPRDLNNPFDIPDGLFRSHFRLPKHIVRELCNDLREVLPAQSRRSAISIEERVLTALRFYATGSYQRIVGAAASLSQKSVSRCVISVTNAINQVLLDRYISFPFLEAERQTVKRRFMDYSNFPGIIGAIDGTHIPLLAPPELDRNFPEHAYINRKGYHSQNCQLVCDAGLKILSCAARYPGSTHDSFIWRHSRLHAALQELHERGQLRNSWLLGDSGYPLQPWLMTPIDNAAPQSPEAKYNQRHCRARNPVERCFGLMKSRFRCLHKHRTLHYAPTSVAKIFNACAVLHNICVHNNLQWDEPEREDGFDVDEGPQDEPQEQGRRVDPNLAAARLIRQRLVRYFARNQ